MLLALGLCAGWRTRPAMFGECGVGDGEYLRDCVMERAEVLVGATALMLVFAILGAVVLGSRRARAARWTLGVGVLFAVVCLGPRWVELVGVLLRAPLV
jgi:hypothetical protein